MNTYRFVIPMLAVLVMHLNGCGGGEADAPGRGTSNSVISDREAQRRKTVIFDIDGGRVMDPKLWNPFVPGIRKDQGYHQAMIEPLFILNYETWEIMPWLATSMTSNENLDVWMLELREGIRWSDGEVFDADDVVFTVNMLLDHAPQLLKSGSLATWVKKVEKTGNRTVRFDLKNPNPRFQLDYWSVRTFDSVPIVPEHLWSGQDPLTFKFYDPARGLPVMTGPYQVRSVSENQFIYERDDNWWGAASGWKPLPRPERLVWVWYGPEETKTAAIADHQLDSINDITLGAFLALRQRNPNVIAWETELPYALLDPCSRTLEVNHTQAPWNDKDMRWALNHAVDREQIVQIAYEGTTQASRHFFPAYPPLNRLVKLLVDAGLYEQYPLSRHDPDQARQIIESKGYRLNARNYYEKDGQELTLDITTHEAFIEKQRIAQVVVEQLQRVGINAATRNEAGGTWDDNFRFGRFESRLGWHACGSVNEPWASMDTFNIRWAQPTGTRTQFNGWRWKNQAYSDIVDEIGSLPLGNPQIDDLFVRAMVIWLEELPIIPITQARKLIPFDTTYWTNWPTRRNNYFQAPTWWNNAHVIIHNLVPARK